jgi:hypothetical protein
VFVGFSRIFLLGILIFKGLTARRLYKSFGVKGLSIGLRVVHSNKLPTIRSILMTIYMCVLCLNKSLYHIELPVPVATRSKT